MARWRYRITIHQEDDILEELHETVDDIPPALYCDDKGACYFDAGPNPFTQAIEHVLTEIGDEGWELVQIAFRPDEMICFWKQPR